MGHSRDGSRNLLSCLRTVYDGAGHWASGQGSVKSAIRSARILTGLQMLDLHIGCEDLNGTLWWRIDASTIRD